MADATTFEQTSSDPRRGLSPETALALGIVRSGEKIGFKYLSRGKKPLFVKYRDSSKNFYIEPAGVKLSLWNLPALAAYSLEVKTSSAVEPLIITEGEFDAASCVEVGFEYVVSVPNGAPAVRGTGDIDPLRDRAFAYLYDENGQLIDGLKQAEKIILATDNDTAGMVLRDELAVRLGADRCYAVLYPPDCKDANDVLLKHGADKLATLIHAAFPLVANRLVTISKIPIRPRLDSYKSGWSILDNHLNLIPPELVIITGTPSSGKSQWSLNWLLNISHRYEVRGAVIQLEDDVERLRRDLNTYARVWENRPTNYGTLYSQADFLEEFVLVMPPSEEEEDSRDLKWLKETVKEAATRHYCKWVLIDPWNEVEHMFSKGVSEHEYLSQAIRAIRRLARRYNIAIIIVAHPDKWAGVNLGIEEMSLYNIAGGAVWKNRADHGIVVAREKGASPGTYTGNTTIKVDKCRDQPAMGTPGMITLEFDTSTRLYREARSGSPAAPVPITGATAPSEGVTLTKPTDESVELPI